jgi:uncharacterized protein with von Willebrand factor type A (vWA) domain
VSILDKLVKGAAREGKRAVQLHRHASEHTPLDSWVLDDLKATAPDFRKALEQPITLNDGQAYEPSADIHDDLFLTAHAPGESRAKRADEVRPSHRLGRDVLDAFVKTAEHRDTKPYTESDEIASAIYARAASEEFDKLMRDKALEEQVKASQDAAEREQMLEDIRQAIDEARAQAQQAASNGQPIPDDVAQEVKDLTQQRERVAGQIADMAANMPQGIPTAVQPQIEQAAQAAQDHVDTWAAVAGSGASELGNVKPDDAWALTEAWMKVPNYQDFCRILGRVMRDFRSQESKQVIHGGDDIIGIEQGADLTRTLTTELMQLGHPDLRRKFLRDYMDEALLQFQTEGTERVSNGPGIICVDLSGSMGRALEALATAVGFVRLMHKRKRDAMVICFNAGVKWERHFKRNEGLDMQALLELAGLRGTGGTDITVAVRKAKEYVDKAPTFKKADVVVITDGQDSYGAEDARISEHFREKGVRTHGIAIGAAAANNAWLMSFCDDAISVKDLTEATGDLVRAVA